MTRRIKPITVHRMVKPVKVKPAKAKVKLEEPQSIPDINKRNRKRIGE